MAMTLRLSRRQWQQAGWCSAGALSFGLLLWGSTQFRVNSPPETPPEPVAITPQTETPPPSLPPETGLKFPDESMLRLAALGGPDVSFDDSSPIGIQGYGGGGFGPALVSGSGTMVLSPGAAGHELQWLGWPPYVGEHNGWLWPSSVASVVPRFWTHGGGTLTGRSPYPPNDSRQNTPFVPPVEVPEPGMIGLMVAALGVGLMARRGVWRRQER